VPTSTPLASLGSLGDRPVHPRATADELAQVLGGDLPEDGEDPAATFDVLATRAEPGLMPMPSGRFFGWVIGGTTPASLAADWLVNAWDQNSALRYPTPAVAALEETAGAWLLDLLHLPEGAAVGFVTGATMANFGGLAAARHHVLRPAGWDVHAAGLTGAPRVHVLVGAERHETVDAALPRPAGAGPRRRRRPDPSRRARRGARGAQGQDADGGGSRTNAFSPMFSTTSETWFGSTLMLAAGTTRLNSAARTLARKAYAFMVLVWRLAPDVGRCARCPRPLPGDRATNSSMSS
jgi:hypothetical protein